MPKIENIRTVSVPSIGKLPLAENPGSFTPSATKREHKPGRLAADGGFVESETPARLEASVNLLTGLPVDKLNAVENADITVRLASGAVYLMSQAFVSEPIGFGDDQAKITIISNTSERIS